MLAALEVGRQVELMVAVNASCFESMLASCYFLCDYLSKTLVMT